MASKAAGDAYTFALKYPLGADPPAVNAKTAAVKTMLGQASFPTNYAARVPSRRRLLETAGHRRRLITVSGVAAPVAALDAEVVIVVEVLASDPGAFESLLNASAAAATAASRPGPNPNPNANPNANANPNPDPDPDPNQVRTFRLQPQP